MPLIADAAGDCWRSGRTFELGKDVKVARSLLALIDQCNWEIERRSRAT
jgi:hypothetical protein